MHYGPTMMETKMCGKQFIEAESNVCKLFEEFYICMHGNQDIPKLIIIICSSDWCIALDSMEYLNLIRSSSVVAVSSNGVFNRKKLKIFNYRVVQLTVKCTIFFSFFNRCCAVARMHTNEDCKLLCHLLQPQPPREAAQHTNMQHEIPVLNVK